MAKNITNSRIAKNVGLSVVVQAVSLLTSFILGFIVPKFIEKIDYSYWQSYTLYIAYVNIFQFGLLEGILLRYSQYDYEELNKPRIRSLLRFMMAVLSLFSAAGIALSFVFQGEYRWVVIFISVGILTKNLFNYTIYIYQVCNRINLYALIVIVHRLIYALIVVILIATGVKSFYLYCVAELISDILASVIGAIFSKPLYVGRGNALAEIFTEAKACTRAGVQLLIANISSGLLISGAKMVVEWHWDSLTFSDVSFAFSLFGVFFSFLTAIGTVLFPSLKRLKEEQLPSIYKKFRDQIQPLVFGMLLLYFPACYILTLWLPNYSASLYYLGISLPMVVFASKVTLLTNNYLKIYRKEKAMLAINLASVVVCFVLCLLSAYVFNNLIALLYILTFVSIGRAIVSEIFVMRILGQRFVLDFFIEIGMAVAFVLCAQLLSLWIGCLVYGVTFVAYLLLSYKKLAGTWQSIKARLKKKQDH